MKTFNHYADVVQWRTTKNVTENSTSKILKTINNIHPFWYEFKNNKHPTVEKRRIDVEADSLVCSKEIQGLFGTHTFLKPILKNQVFKDSFKQLSHILY